MAAMHDNEPSLENREEEPEPPEVFLAGTRASRNGWLRMADGTPGKVYYHHLERGHVTLEKPSEFGDEIPLWPDGTEIFVFRGSCGRCLDHISRRESDPVVMPADHGKIAIAFVLCRPCLNWLVESAQGQTEAPQRKSREKKSHNARGQPRHALPKVYRDVDMRGVGDLLLRSSLARDMPKCLFAQLSEVTLRPGRFEEQCAVAMEAKKAVVVAGEARRQTAKAMQMKLRCISEFGMQGGDYLCWYDEEGRVEYFGETKAGKANGWGLLEYQDGGWCTSEFRNGQQNTKKGGPPAVIRFANGQMYTGAMAKGKMHGRGTKTWPDGTEYTGDFTMGKEHGRGVKRWPDGSEHNGEFRHGVRDGPGVYIDARGIKTSQVFKDTPFQREEDGAGSGGDGTAAASSAAAVRVSVPVAHEQGHHNPSTLLDLAVRGLAVVTDRQPGLRRASELKEKVPEHLLGKVAASLIEVGTNLSPGFRKVVPSIAWQDVAEVRLHCVRLRLADAEKLAYFLEANTGLRSLALVSCKLDGAGARPVAAAIAEAPALVEVDVGWNPIRREGAEVIMAAVAVSRSVTRLSLTGCSLGVDGGRAVAAAVEVDTRLRDLDMAFNALGGAVAGALAAAVAANETLTRLNLRSNSLGPAGGKVLARGMVANRGGLRELIVADNHTGGRAAARVAGCMKGSARACLAGFGLDLTATHRPQPGPHGGTGGGGGGGGGAGAPGPAPWPGRAHQGGDRGPSNSALGLNSEQAESSTVLGGGGVAAQRAPAADSEAEKARGAAAVAAPASLRAYSAELEKELGRPQTASTASG